MRSQILPKHAPGGVAPALGIIAGGGNLPLRLAEACQANGRPCFILALENAADLGAISHLPHRVVHFGAVGDAISHLRDANVKDVVMAGNVRRPSLLSLRPDMAGARLLARLGKAFFPAMTRCSRRSSLFEDEGFKVVGAEEILAGLVAPEGVLGNIRPHDRARADIVHGMKIAKEIGKLDIGQAVIVEHGYVLGVEGAEGTDELIMRCGKLRREMNSGVLVKVMKPAQEGRVDRPAIGVQTVEKIHAAGFAGIAVEAGGGIILDQDKTIKTADRLGVFVVGINISSPWKGEDQGGGQSEYGQARPPSQPSPFQGEGEENLYHCRGSVGRFARRASDAGA